MPQQPPAIAVPQPPHKVQKLHLGYNSLWTIGLDISGWANELTDYAQCIKINQIQINFFSAEKSLSVILIPN